MDGATTQLSLLCPTRLVPQRHDAQALLLSAWPGILQEFLGKILALQVEVATLHGAACCLDLSLPGPLAHPAPLPAPAGYRGPGKTVRLDLMLPLRYYCLRPQKIWYEITSLLRTAFSGRCVLLVVS